MNMTGPVGSILLVGGIFAVVTLDLLAWALCRAAAAGDRALVDWEARGWFDLEESPSRAPRSEPALATSREE